MKWRKKREKKGKEEKQEGLRKETEKDRDIKGDIFILLTTEEKREWSKHDIKI